MVQFTPLMMIRGTEVVLWLSYIETPWSKSVIAISRFGWSRVCLNLDSTDGSTICRCSIPGFIRHGIWVWIGHWIRHGQNSAKTRQENNCKGQKLRDVL